MPVRNEPVYCICRKVEFGKMVQCDNEKCKEWFHFPCVGMTRGPAQNVNWFCEVCRPAFKQVPNQWNYDTNEPPKKTKKPALDKPSEKEYTAKSQKQLGVELSYKYIHMNKCGIENDGGEEKRKISATSDVWFGDIECDLTDCRSLEGNYQECPKNCPKEDCKNRRFSKKLYKQTAVYEDLSGKGKGLRAKEDILIGEFIMEFTGLLYTTDAFKEILRERRATEPNGMTYHVEVISGLILDPLSEGNSSRFINHACDANCMIQTWWVAGKPRLGLFARKNINNGDELTWNYGDSYSGGNDVSGHYVRPIRCLCGAATCRGYITSEAVAKKLRKRAAQRRKYRLAKKAEKIAQTTREETAAKRNVKTAREEKKESTSSDPPAVVQKRGMKRVAERSLVESAAKRSRTKENLPHAAASNRTASSKGVDKKAEKPKAQRVLRSALQINR